MRILSQLKFLFFTGLLKWCPKTRWFALKRGLARLAGLSIGQKVRFHSGVQFETLNVHLGDGTWVGRDTLFMAQPNARIVIGKNCDIAPGCAFVAGSHEIGLSDRRAGPGWGRPITVGDGTWIGARSTVLGGITIGAGCIVAAGAVVTKDVPDNVLVGGVPARVIRELDAEEDVSAKA